MSAEVRKVALLVSCLSRRLAASLLERLPEDRAGEVRRQLQKMPQVDAAERQRVVQEFLAGGRLRAKRRLRIDPAADSLPPSFHFLLPLQPAELVRLLADELPQLQAAVLAHLPPNLAGEALVLCSSERRLQVARRLAELRPVSPLAMCDIAEILRRILHRHDSARNKNRSGAEALDQILTHSSGPVRQILGETVAHIQNSAADVQRPANGGK